MTPEERFESWKSYADRDLDAAKAMLETGRWFYVLFMCQQAVEKLVKGIYSLYVNGDVARTHNIGLLANHIEDSADIVFDEETYELFNSLTKYYLADRYPDYLSKAGAQVDEKQATDIFNKTKEVFTWMQTLKPSED